MPRKRGARPIHAEAVLALWAACNRRDRAYVMCYMYLQHEAVAARLRPPGLLGAVQRALGTLGLTGRIASAILGALDALTPADVLQCETVVQRGPTER